MTQTPIDFEIRGEFIQLDQLLKAMGLVHSGGAAHQVIAEGRVTVDGIVELRKRAKLRLLIVKHERWIVEYKRRIECLAFEEWKL